MHSLFYWQSYINAIYEGVFEGESWESCGMVCLKHLQIIKCDCKSKFLICKDKYNNKTTLIKWNVVCQNIMHLMVWSEFVAW